ncbi:MAG: sulfatase-like hydrolase/transferase [Oscillospiraceae bacterium]|nr:sulfatase-like hydrolase/transferase [Oscillospiraceae bacterium]
MKKFSTKLHHLGEKCFLFADSAAEQSGGKKAAFWAWNIGITVCAFVALGLLALIFAVGEYPFYIIKGYFEVPLIAVLNVLPVLALGLLLYFLTSRSALSFVITAVVVLGMSIGNYFKLLFRDDPFLVADIPNIAMAMRFTGGDGYAITLNWQIILSLVCVIFGGAFLALFVRGRMKKAPRFALALAVVLCGFCMKSVYLNETVYEVRARNYNYVSPWGATQTFISRGFLYPFIYSVTDAFPTPPEGYDEAEAAEILAQYESGEIAEEKKVNIIAIQLEAFNDFSRMGAGGVDWDAVYADYHALEEESYTGNLVTNIFAGGTINTERCAITGHLELENYRANVNSHAWYLQTQGYTVEGSHPYYDWYYNRRNVNSYLGFPAYYYYDEYMAMAGGIRDSIMFPQLCELYEEGIAKDKPYFSYNVTYQGHGPYSAEENTWGTDFVTGDMSEASRNILNNYLGSVQDTVMQIHAMIDYFRNREEPMVVLLFGDHNPWLGDGNTVYRELGINIDPYSEEGFYNYYATRYLIWGNDAAKETLGTELVGEGPDVSSNFLMNELFTLLGWEGSAYMQATEAIREEISVLTSVDGYVTEAGFANSLTGEAAETLRKYLSLAYYDAHHFIYQDLIA